MVQREHGQIFPLMAALLLTVLALGFALFQVARAAVWRSEAQTAADAAALAGVRNAKQQLDAMMTNGGNPSVDMIQDGPVRAAAADYAKRNGARVTYFYRRGADVKIRVETLKRLGKDAKRVDSQNVKGKAKARARIDVESDTAGAGGVGSATTGGGPSTQSGDGKITNKEWDEFAKKQLKGKKARPCSTSTPEDDNDMVKLGRFLASKGIRVSENAADWDVPMARPQNPNSQHFRCNNTGALDLNFDFGGGTSPQEQSTLDPIRQKAQELGYGTVFKVAGHFNHLHIQFGASMGPGAGGAAGGAPGGGGGFVGGDQAMVIRLIDWDAEYEEFNLYPTDAALTGSFGEPDPNVLRIMCRVLADRKVSKRVRLATFMTALVETNARNFLQAPSDRDSAGVFQQRNHWGTLQQRYNVAWATNKYLNGNPGNPGAISLDRWWPGTTGQMAQRTQGSAFPDRYDERRGQAVSLHNQYCNGVKISQSD